MIRSPTELPVPPGSLSSPPVTLRRAQVEPGDEARGLVPYYHFRIVLPDGQDIGHINFRVGNTPHVIYCAGHIGFEIVEGYRGHGYAGAACRALAPFARTICEEVIITCDPDNIASIRTIERLGANYIDEVAVPEDDPHYKRGSRWKRRYLWHVAAEVFG